MTCASRRVGATLKVEHHATIRATWPYGKTCGKRRGDVRTNLQRAGDVARNGKFKHARVLKHLCKESWDSSARGRVKMNLFFRHFVQDMFLLALL